MEEILKTAAAELGIREVPGPDHNERIVQYAEEAGFSWINDDETPWCSIFVNWVAKKTSFRRSGSAAARSWLNAGFSVDKPEPGDIVVYWRESRTSHKGHVGIYLGYSKDMKRIYTLGGNQRDSVSVSAYPAERLLGFRRLIKEADIHLADVVLKRGNRGRNVALLQDALKMAGFECGTSDGIFGPKTENAIKELQSRNTDLGITGIFDSESRIYLLSLLN